jgi:outer membrane cobalamin receptor
MTINDLAYGAARSVSASSVTRSAFAHATWAVTPSLTLSSGVRVSASSLLPDHAGSRWLLGEWVFRPGWSLNVSSGVSQQLPELSYIRGQAESVKLRPERANFIDLGIEQRLTNSIRWQATVFSRGERDILRDPDIHPRVIGGLLVFPERESYVNALSGKSRGIELVVDRRRPNGLSGWLSYSYGKTRYSDGERRETYWGNFDQRHSVNLFATYRLSSRTGVGATFRAGSNFPIPAYLTARDDGFFIASARNQVRLPRYARLDLRADRQFDYLGRRLTVFVELLNSLNRANMSLSNGSVDAASGQAIGFTDTLFRRRASAGLIVDF